MKPLYIFDLDGTLADVEHRRHFIRQPACPHCGWLKECDHTRDGTRAAFTPDWRGFYAACADDPPIMPVIITLRALRDAGAEIWIWSGRSDEVAKDTVQWLRTYSCLGLAPLAFSAPEAFKMRRADDHRPDEALKGEWLSLLDPPERDRLTATFDDRDSMVRMWRAAGIPCFQVAPGDF